MMNQNLDIQQLNARLERKTTRQIIEWAAATFWPDIGTSSSFQTQSLPLLHILAQMNSRLPVIFVDTGYHFPETLAFRDRLVREWDLNLRVVRANLPEDKFVQQDGHELYRTNPDLCCYINKVAPMEQAISGLRAWISGIRRDQSPQRANTQIIEQTPQGVLRIHPMANWTRQDLWQYIHDHQLPEHPLLKQGYLSVGCAPCTQPIFDPENERAGRWMGHQKAECGLHTLLRQPLVDASTGNPRLDDDKDRP